MHPAPFLVLILVVLACLGGCAGEDGATGPPGPPGDIDDLDGVAQRLAEDPGFRTAVAQALADEHADQLKGDSGDCNCGGSSGGNGGGSGGHWQLRDQNGDAVNAWVSPSFSTDLEDLRSIDFDMYYNFRCFGASFLGDRYLSPARYDLNTGLMGPCYEDYASWRDVPSIEIGYFTPSCDSRPYYNSRNYVGIRVYQVGSVLHYTSGMTRIETATRWSVWEDGECVLRQAPENQPFLATPFERVPDSVLDAFEDGAPYTLTPEY